MCSLKVCISNPKEAEELRQQQKKEFQALQTAIKKRKEEASKILAKLTSEQFMIGNVIKSKDVKTMPDMVVAKVKATNAKMVGIIAECKDVLKGTAEECSITLKEADQLVKTSGLQRDFVNNLISQNMMKAMP